MTVLGRGAEATITQTADGVRKHREEKPYRHPELDKRLRQFRTRREAKILDKLTENAPKLLAVDDKNMTIDMEFLDGQQLRDVLSEDNAEGFMKQLATIITDMHNQGIVHGDLTTSNIMVVEETLYLVDFGLAEFSDHVEEQAVDLHLLKHAFAAKHPELALWETFWKAYAPSEELLERFEQVEARGRYKGKNA